LPKPTALLDPGVRELLNLRTPAFSGTDGVIPNASYEGLLRSRFYSPHLGLRLWVRSFRKKVRYKRYKRYKSPSHVQACRSLLDHGRSITDGSAEKFRQVDFGRQNVALLTPSQCGDKRDDISAYALRIGERPVCHPASIQRPCHLAWDGLRAVVWCFPSCQNCSIKRTH